jgi:hypothetical protein
VGPGRGQKLGRGKAQTRPLVSGLVRRTNPSCTRYGPAKDRQCVRVSLSVRAAVAPGCSTANVPLQVTTGSEGRPGPPLLGKSCGGGKEKSSSLDYGEGNLAARPGCEEGTEPDPERGKGK